MSVKPRTPIAGPGTLVCEQSAFTWNGHTVVIPSIVDLAPVFGKPDRVTPGTNRLLTWDALGLVAYVETRSKQLISLAVIFRHDVKHGFIPSSVFASHVVTPWIAIRPSTTKEELAAAGFEDQFNQYFREGPTTSFYVSFNSSGELTELQLCRNE